MQVLFVGPIHSEGTGQDDVRGKIDRALQEGFSVVPGTIVIDTIQYIPTSKEVPITSNGTAFKAIMAIVLQKG